MRQTVPLAMPTNTQNNIPQLQEVNRAQDRQVKGTGFLPLLSHILIAAHFAYPRVELLTPVLNTANCTLNNAKGPGFYLARTVRLVRFDLYDQSG